MLLSPVYLVIRMLLRLIVPEGQREAAKDLEIVVLRQQLNPSGDRSNGPLSTLR